MAVETIDDLTTLIQNDPQAVRQALELIKRTLPDYPSASAAADADRLSLHKDSSGGIEQLQIATLLSRVVENNGGAQSLEAGPIADRPVAGNADHWYLATDEPRLYRDDGASWAAVLGNAAGADLAQNGGTLPEVDQNETITGQYTFTAHLKVEDDTTGITSRNPLASGGTFTPLRVHNHEETNIARIILRDDDGAGGGYLDIDNDSGIVINDISSGPQGPGTLNGELYDNGNRVATSDYVFDADQDGQIDTAYYDSVIGTQEVESDTETEKVEEEVEVTETVEEPVDEWCPKNGCYERKMVPRERPVYDEYPVLDADGNQVSTKRVPRKEKRPVQRPRRVEVQLQHKPARRFEHDDLDPATFAAKCQQRRKLPAMDRCEQSLREGQQKPSLGEWTQALMETCEVYAIHELKLLSEIKDLKARLAALEGQ